MAPAMTERKPFFLQTKIEDAIIEFFRVHGAYIEETTIDLGYSDEEFHELDLALEAFSARVPYDPE